MDDLGRCRPLHINITFPPPRGVLHVCRTLGAKEECDGIYVSRKVTSQANSLLSPAILNGEDTCFDKDTCGIDLQRVGREN